MSQSFLFEQASILNCASFSSPISFPSLSFERWNAAFERLFFRRLFVSLWRFFASHCILERKEAMFPDCCFTVEHFRLVKINSSKLLPVVFLLAAMNFPRPKLFGQFSMINKLDIFLLSIVAREPEVVDEKWSWNGMERRDRDMYISHKFGFKTEKDGRKETILTGTNCYLSLED